MANEKVDSQVLTKRTPSPTSSAKLRRARGASSIEYMLVLILVVFPIALMVPAMTAMITVYTSRIAWAIRLPFG